MRFVAIMGILCLLSSCWTVRAYKVRHLRLTDHERIRSVPLYASDKPFIFGDATQELRAEGYQLHLNSLLENTNTAAFLVIKNDSIVYEKYFMGFDKSSILPSHSMAKSFTSTLAGIAIEEGTISSVNDPVTKYIPELAKRDIRFKNITIRHLLDMRSGLKFNEGSYDIHDDAIKLGFRPNLVKHILKIEIEEAPGHFRYQSVNTQLLGIVIERASGKKLQDYMQEKLWGPMGAEYAATWNTDNREHVMTSAGINATARDFAKLGRLFLKNGKCNGNQVVTEKWVASISNGDTMARYDGYRNMWWNKKRTGTDRDSVFFAGNTQPVNIDRHIYSLPSTTNAYMAFGFMEQVIYVNPDRNLIIVRLGKHWPDPYTFVQQIYELGERF